MLKWKVKPKPKDGTKKYRNEYLIFPVKYKEYWYWLGWVTVEFTYNKIWGWPKCGKIVKIGKNKGEFKDG